MTIIQESAERVAKGMTPYPSKYLVLEAVNSFTSSRFGKVKAGERRTVRYGYENPTSPLPEVVTEVRNGKPIDWGGAVLMPASYRVLFDGPGPLPASLR